MASERPLVETLNQLSPDDFDRFKSLVEVEKDLPPISKSRLKEGRRQDVVELLLGTDCVDVTRKVLMRMERSVLGQRFPAFQPGDKKTPPPSLRHRVEALVSDTELLLETLADLTDEDLGTFKRTFGLFHRQIPNELMESDLQDSVCLMVQTYGHQTVEKAAEVLGYMKRKDLALRLTHSGSTPRRQQLGEHLSAAIHKVATFKAVTDLLVETLTGLDRHEVPEFMWLLQYTLFHRSLPQLSGRAVNSTDTTLTVDMLVETLGLQSVDVTREVLSAMRRTDLVQRLPERGSGSREEPSVDEDWPALTPKVEALLSVTEQLVETLAGLSSRECWTFKRLLTATHRNIPLKTLLDLDLQASVILMVQRQGLRSLKSTMDVLEDMKKSDLVQRHTDSSSNPQRKQQHEHPSALIHKVVTVVAVKQLLVEALKHLSYGELGKFKTLLQLTMSEQDLSDVSESVRATPDRDQIVDLLVDELGQRCVKVIRDVFVDMGRTDLVQQLNGPSSESRKRRSMDQCHQALSKAKAERAAVTVTLVEMLSKLDKKGFKKFRWWLHFTLFQRSLRLIPWSSLRVNTRQRLAALMVKKHGLQCVDVTREVLRDINQRPPDSSSGSEGAQRGLEAESCGRGRQDASDWTKVDPEVNERADEAPTYSLQTAAGCFECRVSGLRWLCEGQTSFQYQFCSWEGHMQRMESRQYMPAGPLLDITVTAGRLNEVHLPHWICTEDNPKILDRFAVLHVKDCGDEVEKVSEVTASHVRLTRPMFSPRAVLMKVGLPVKISCSVLLYYKLNTPFLKLHVYLIPHDPALQQTVEKKETSGGYGTIRKPRPDRYLKMLQGFVLTADTDAAKIQPQKLTLRYDSQDPNFYEVFIESPDRNFTLTLLLQSKPSDPVWSSKIRKDDHPHSGPSEAAASSGEADGVSTLSDEQHCEQLDTQVQETSSDLQRLLNLLEELTQDELKRFKWSLQGPDQRADRPGIPWGRLETADRLDLVNLMLQTYGQQQSVAVTRSVFREMSRMDLVQRMSDW
ncbi:uncharacterized protein LOC114448224 isoform X3 [Parambassis ranga]|uniref:Uncharacterized protein LOC114448224 isoform X3 n=1 Tax=Parambassis ranga TaxID=210632 RepID=A0A6P7JVV1_9TELE|nr:uncharacterized protein LOC114448224 isoform X3 [Parambassis ranga]